MKELQDINLRELIENETGNRFKKKYIKCPFHNEKTPSLSVYFNANQNKEVFKCFGCSEYGDAIDFILKLRNLDYIEAREYLGLEIDEEYKEKKEKIHSKINEDIQAFRVGQELLGVFEFKNANGEIIYYKAKFKDGEKKTLSYYYIDETGSVINARCGEEIPYNYNKALKVIKDRGTIIIVEGEKDANMVNSLRLYKTVAISMKGCKDYDFLKDARVSIIGDTGKAGEEYVNHLKFNLKDKVKSLKIVTLPGVKAIGDNKDVSDWLESGKDKEDLQRAINKALDLKDERELQQTKLGIKKTIFKKGAEGEDEKKEIYLTNFSIQEAKKIRFVDDDTEGIRLTLKTDDGQVFEREGNISVFDDVKAFKHFLNAIELTFKGKLDNLTELKIWINKYFVFEEDKIYHGMQFVERENKKIFIYGDGSIDKDGDFIRNIKTNSRDNIDISNIDFITKEELIDLKQHLFNFASKDKTFSILGTIFNNLLVLQNKELKKKLHHLLIVGESGSGKSTILENVVATILNIDKKEVKSIGLITKFALIKELSKGNYPILFDEFKPSMMDKYTIANLSEMFRNSYDRATISRGNKSLETKEFELNRPLIVAGEESYPNSEKALIERSNIVYLSKNERKSEHTKAMNWIIEHEELLNKLGRSLVQVALDVNTEEYLKLRNSYNIKELNNRPLHTAINTCCGIELFNKLAERLGVERVNNYLKPIVENLTEEVLDSREDTYSVVENMIITFDTMIADGRANGPEDIIFDDTLGVLIKTSEMINQLKVFAKSIGVDTIILNNKDFKKQAKKSGIILGDKLKKVNKKVLRCDIYSKEKLGDLKLGFIYNPDGENELKTLAMLDDMAASRVSLINDYR